MQLRRKVSHRDLCLSGLGSQKGRGSGVTAATDRTPGAQLSGGGGQRGHPEVSGTPGSLNRSRPVSIQHQGAPRGGCYRARPGAPQGGCYPARPVGGSAGRLLPRASTRVLRGEDRYRACPVGGSAGRLLPRASTRVLRGEDRYRACPVGGSAGRLLPSAPSRGLRREAVTESLYQGAPRGGPLPSVPRGIAEEQPTQQDEKGCGHTYFFEKVIGGEEAMDRKWPWQVSVQKNGNHLCGGSLVAPLWVLTAANCLNPNDNYTVYMGTAELKERYTLLAVRVPVKEVVIHPNYEETRYWSWIGRENNVALLKLAQRVKFTEYIAPVCIAPPSMEVRAGSFCWLTGWGQTTIPVEGEDPQLSPVLQEAEITILGNDDCDSHYHDISEVPSIVRIISSNMLCSDYSRGKDFCTGDDGSPLVCEYDFTWFQVGVVSWSLGCAHLETPGVYSRVSEYALWIEKEIAELNYAASTLMTSSGITPLSLLLPISLMMAL
ncbi:probable threonine protease PRSS50 [Notamacropus eugenii]|uniref:probable threonine protease PRSS50 n=1 Tax=Notamacropus eugenii TaxID=9315 RepID=UPI003B67915B